MYKVLTKHNDRLFSSFAYLDPKFYIAYIAGDYPHILEYKLGEWTEPIINQSKLFVFNNLTSAQHFLKLNCHPIIKFGPNATPTRLIITKCEVENHHPCQLICPTSASEHYGEWWAHRQNHSFDIRQTKVPTRMAPFNTHVADKVKITDISPKYMPY